MGDLILHKRSVVVNDGIPKLPTPDQLAYGELAINFADGHETLTIRNSADKIAEFKSKEYFENIIIENELVTAEALNNLNERITSFEENLLHEITYDELVTLRNNGELIPGQLYRIIDYVTTTTQFGTLSAGHPFDVIILALNENALAEEAYAVNSERDTDGYFANSNLSAWKIWYSLDNDTAKFAWADAENGKGVIYRMIDEFNNDIPYDFKNIMYEDKKGFGYFQWGNNYAFMRNESLDKQIDGVQYYGYTSDVTPSAWSNGNCLITDETPTMTSDLYQEDGSAISYGGNITSVNLDEKIYYTFAEADDLNGSSYGNEIKPYKKDGAFTLNKIIFGNNCFSNTFGYDCSRNTFGNGCESNTFGNGCSDNTFGNGCHNNSFENTCYSNTFGNECQSNTFGYNCDGNIFEYSCSHNTFGENCVDNTLGSDCGNITIGNGCRHNKFGMYCLRNSLGNYCSENTFGNGCWDNSFRVSASVNSSIVGYCQYNHFDDGCSYNVIWSTVNPSNVNSFRNININRGVCSREGVYNYINIETLNSEHEINVNQIDGIVSVGKILSIRYASLKSLRDNGQLIAGQQYRIIDYVTTTSQAGTKSAGHQFDLIVTADDNKTLNEKVRAIQHEGDTYFANSDLNAWEVWYCFDNDSERFAWAGMPDNISSVSDGTRTFNYILPISYVVFKEKTYTLKVGKRTMIWGGPPVYVTLLEDGKSLYVEDNSSYITMSSILEVHLQHTGIIYRMIDEFNNDCPYDFKNILYSLDDAIVECEIQKYGSWFEGAFTRDSTNDKLINNEQYYAWFYTITSGPSGSGICYTKEELISVDSILYNDSGSEFSDVKLLSVISEVYTFGMGKSADLSGNCYNNSIGVYNALGKQELNRITFGDGCDNNTFGNDCNNNTFGNDCNNNTFGVNCSGNTLGNTCMGNIFKNGCGGNTFGTNCNGNIFGNNCTNNTFGNGCGGNTFGNNCTNNTFGNGCGGNTFGYNCNNNSFGGSCYSNSFGNNCYYNSFNSSASNTGTLLNYCHYNHFDDGCSYNVIWNDVQPTSSNKLQNINVVRGVYGTSSVYNFINIVEKNTAYEIKVAKNSDGEIKVYCAADFDKQIANAIITTLNTEV